MSAQTYSLEVQARLPEALAGLKPLSENLLYAWDRHIRGLFRRMDPGLWERCGHNPRVFLRRISHNAWVSLPRTPRFSRNTNTYSACSRPIAIRPVIRPACWRSTWTRRRV